MLRSLPLRLCFLWLLIGRTALAADGEWPLYRHDARLTGATSSKGRIDWPAILWKHYLGAPTQATVSHGGSADAFYDLDGDGTPEHLLVDGKTLRVQDRAGAELCSIGVNGRPLSSRLRTGKLFRDRPGLQVVSFSQRMDTGEGQGYCFTFDRGARRGALAWTTGPLKNQYWPTLVIDDVDGDGRPEIVNAPHYGVQIFDALTGAIKAEVPWDVGRNYGLLATRPRHDAPQKDIFIVCDFVPHVDCIRYRDGKWIHAWGHKYFDPNAAMPRGREVALRVGPNPVADLDGDDRDEVTYMVADASQGEDWHLHVRDGETGRIKLDAPAIWLWSVRDLDGDGRCELIYSPTSERRPKAFCELHIGTLTKNGLEDRAVLKDVRPLITEADLPDSVDTIADEGRHDLLLADSDADGKKEVFVVQRTGGSRADDRLAAVQIAKDGSLRTVWHFERPDHRLELVRAGRDDKRRFSATVRDFDRGTELSIDERGRVVREAPLGEPAGFSTTPIVVDLDGDGRNEVVLQTAQQRIEALRFVAGRDAPERLWSIPGVAMNSRPGLGHNGDLCVQSADVDGDGRPEIVFAAEDKSGSCSLVCADGQGRIRWRHVFEKCPWGGVQAGVNFWTFGRFSGRDKGCDVYVDWHRRSRISNEGCVLSGEDGRVLWNRQGLIAKETAMPFGGGIPAVADMNGDGIDDLTSMFWTVFASVSGKTGDPIFAPAYLPGPKYFGRWIGYSSPSLADLDGDGSLDVYLNSASNASGGYAAVKRDGQPLWAEFHGFDRGSIGFGAVADLDGDGKLEVAVPGMDGTLVCLDAKSGKRRWVAKVPVNGDVIAVDVDGDGRRDIVTSGSDNRMWTVRGSDGKQLWSIDAPGRPVAADVDGDKLVELLAVGPDGVLRIVGNDREARK